MKAFTILVMATLVTALFAGSADAAGVPLTVDHGLFGAFRANGTALEGTFVYFKANATTGHVILFSVGASTKDVVFDEVNVTPFVGTTPAVVTGPNYHLAGKSVLITANDDPRSPLSYKAAGDPVRVVFRQSTGISVAASQKANILNVTFGRNEGWLVGTGATFALANGSVTADLSPNGRVTFQMLPRASIWDTRVREVEDALGRQDLAAEGVAAVQDGNLVQDAISYGAAIRVEQVTTTFAKFNVSSPFVTGKSFVLHFDNSTLRLNASKLTLLVNDSPALPSSVLGALVPGTSPRFAVVESSRGLSLFLSVPLPQSLRFTLKEVPPGPTAGTPASSTTASTTIPSSQPPPPAKGVPGFEPVLAVGAVLCATLVATFHVCPRRNK